MGIDDYAYASARDTADALRQRKVSARELTDAAIARIKALGYDTAKLRMVPQSAATKER